MEKETNKKAYEIAFLSPLEAGHEEVVKLLVREGGEIVKEGPIEKIALAYPIEKHVSAYFGYLHFMMEPLNAKNLEHDLTTNNSILRYLIITPPFEPQKPRSMGRPRGAKVQSQESAPTAEKKSPASSLPLSNEALEKKIEEILQQ